MTYKIIGDSCMDLTKDMKRDPHFQLIPLVLQVEEHQMVDDETFDQKKFLELVKASKDCPKTACPSPESFKEAYQCEAEYIFVITISEHLSGTYNSALLGKELYEEEYGEKKICVMSSDSASAGQVNLALYIQSLCQAALPFEEIIEKAMEYKKEMNTYFVLESLDTLRKNGRLTGLQAFFATALNIKPIMGADNGSIVKLDQARGISKALTSMVEIALKRVSCPEEKVLVIAHCNNQERAELVREKICKAVRFRDVIITETAGVSTVYANDGGIVLAL